MYSLIETAKANGREPYAYLKKVFTLPPPSCKPRITKDSQSNVNRMG
nr:transposase domain-containing protein [Neptunomonas antarctica]